MTTRANGPVEAPAVHPETARPIVRASSQAGAVGPGNVVKFLSARDTRDEVLRSAQSSEPEDRSDPADDGAWRRLPKGIALSMLLAVPFWLALIFWLVW